MTQRIHSLEISVGGKMLLYETALADNPDSFDMETWKQYRRTKAEYNYLRDKAMREKYQRERMHFNFRKFRQLQGGAV